MAAPICSICLRQDHPDIEAALAAGQSIAATAAQFSISKSALGRHKLNCIAPKLAAAAKMLQPVRQAREPVERAKAIMTGSVPTAGEIMTLTGLVERLARSLDRLEGAAIAAADDNLHSALAAVSGQLHRGVESAARLQGMYAEPEAHNQPKFSINIVIPNQPQWQDSSTCEITSAAPCIEND